MAWKVAAAAPAPGKPMPRSRRRLSCSEAALARTLQASMCGATPGHESRTAARSIRASPNVARSSVVETDHMLVHGGALEECVHTSGPYTRLKINR
jgi:hypothetical protein